MPKTEFWGLSSLAYRIKKNRKGHYVFMNVEAEPTALAEMERTLRFNEDVLRYLSIRVDELDPEASPMMRNKSQPRRRARSTRDPRARATAIGASDNRERRDDRDTWPRSEIGNERR